MSISKVGKRFERKQELIDAALDEFVEHDFESASLNRIIKNAGISKGTFYYHFRNKEDLFLFLTDEGKKAGLEFINNWLRRHPDRSGEKDFFSIIKLQLKIGVDFALEMPRYKKFGERLLQIKDAQIQEKIRAKAKARVEAFLGPMIGAAIQKGEIRSDLSKDFVARLTKHFFLYPGEIFMLDHLDLDDPDSRRKLDKNIDEFFSFLKYGLGRERHEGS